MSDEPFRILSHDCTGVLALKARTCHSFAKHSHEQFGIGFMFEGAQKSLSGRGMVEAGAGNILTVNPREVHDGTPIGQSPRGWNMLYLDPDLIRDAARDMTDGKSDHYEFTSPVITSPDVAHCFADLFAAIIKGDHENAGLRREEMLFLLLHHAIIVPGQPDHYRYRPQSGADASIARAISMIDDAPDENLSLADLASTAGLSRFQTVRHFTRATGLTPHAYIIQRRLDLARRLIATGTPLAEVAATAGFADQSHLNRHFIRAYGLSPGRYAKALQNH
ncbi:AraC family transcriptional regulator [Thalassospira lucentensis]|uniref:AraC family transcriptional regulator n=1 Tax=Thalassospira lucentensis TaxID=168935 RepID=UPI002943773D|nr:AraC family transcriptional regulator [Thalassospira lucentensis]WOI10841.1 AraC family transcriptional regulator [Thalassospira lucentensis]